MSAAVIATASVLLTGLAVVPAQAASRNPTIGASRHYVVQRDSVVLSGKATTTKTLYRAVNGSRYKRYATVHPKHGRYSVKVRPVTGTITRFKVGTSKHVNIHSYRCTPRTTPGTANAWFNLRKQVPAVATNWSSAICSAAPNSTINLSAMLIFGGTKPVDTMIRNLRAVSRWRHIRVNVVVQRSRFPSRPLSDQWTYGHFVKEFSFAHITACAYACTLNHPGDSIHHSKYMTISRSIFGGSMVIESTLNWSPQQFDRQNGSAVYFYNYPALYKAFVAQTVRYQRHTLADSRSMTALWHKVERGVSYAFDPSTQSRDPITRELSGVTCRSGDQISVVNANVTRTGLIAELNRLHKAGCQVRLITQQSYRSPSATYPRARHLRTHDKFVLIRAHSVGGYALKEVLHGSENYRPSSLKLGEQQLVRLRRPTLVSAFTSAFSRQYAVASY